MSIYTFNVESSYQLYLLVNRLLQHPCPLTIKLVNFNLTGKPVIHTIKTVTLDIFGNVVRTKAHLPDSDFPIDTKIELAGLSYPAAGEILSVRFGAVSVEISAKGQVTIHGSDSAIMPVYTIINTMSNNGLTLINQES